MYIYMYVYVCIYIYTHTHTHTHTGRYMFLNLNLDRNLCIYVIRDSFPFSIVRMPHIESSNIPLLFSNQR